MRVKTIIRFSSVLDERAGQRRFYRHGSAAMVGPLDAERFDDDQQAQRVIDSMVESGNWMKGVFRTFTLHLD